MDKEFSRTWKLVRYTLASPFSRTYSAKRRWLKERDEWERLGIAATDMERKVYVAPRISALRRETTSRRRWCSATSGMRPRWSWTSI